MTDVQEAKPATRVFVSYTHDSAEHKERIFELANRLREHGVDCVIDQYEEAPLEGWPRWMEREMAKADHVLVVATENYRRRFDGKENPDIGKGAIWEGGIITTALYNSSGRDSKFIPLVFSQDDTQYIPVILQGQTYYVLSDEIGYQGLYRRLTRQPVVVKPPLGAVIHLPPRERKQLFKEESQPPATDDAVPNDVAPTLDAAFLKRTFPAEIEECRRLKHSLSDDQWTVVRGMVEVATDPGHRWADLADLLYEIGGSENEFHRTFVDLRRLGYLEIDDESPRTTMRLLGRVTRCHHFHSLIEHALVDLDLDPQGAGNLFDLVV